MIAAIKFWLAKEVVEAGLFVAFAVLFGLGIYVLNLLCERKP